MTEFGKLLIIIGAVLLVLGALFLLSGRLPWIGRLPGDIVVHRKNFTFYFPLATSLILSLVLSLILWLVGRK
ncbi:MAG: DUF2905 domain-containing protein [Nitrospirota bacterium]